MLRQCDELLEIPARFLAVAGGFRGACGAVDASIAVRGLLEGRFKLAERRPCLPHLEQQLTEQLAHRIQSVLHRHVLDAAVFTVCRRTHELYRLLRAPSAWAIQAETASLCSSVRSAQ